MSQPFKLPFKLDLNGPLSNPLTKQKPQPNRDQLVIQLPRILNQLYKTRLAKTFRLIKNHHLSSPSLLLKSMISTIKASKKQQKVSYLHYNVQPQPKTPPIPKTAIFNQRIKSLKQSTFLQIKQYSLNTKISQLSTIVLNRQNELLNYLIPKLEQKLIKFALKRITDHGKQQKGRFTIVKVLDRLSKAIIKRVAYSEFFNRTRNLPFQQGRKRLALMKVKKILQCSTRLTLQQSIRRIQTFGQYMHLEDTIKTKKQMISQIYEKNGQRQQIVNKQRQALRSLKYRLDQQAVQKSHVLTDKRRALMLARTRNNEEGKKLGEEITALQNEMEKVRRMMEKERLVVGKVEIIRQAVNKGNENDIGYQELVTAVYRQVKDIDEPQTEHDQTLTAKLVQILQQHHSHYPPTGPQSLPTLQSIALSREFQFKQMQFLEHVVRQLQNCKPSGSSIAGSQTYLNKTMSSSQITTRSLSQSRFLNNSTSTVIVNGSRVVGKKQARKTQQTAQFVKANEQYNLLISLIRLILSKQYELNIKKTLKAELEQLSSLIVDDFQPN